MKLHRWTFIGAISLVFFVCSCLSAREPESFVKAQDTKQAVSAQPPVISGHVYRADTGAPIAKARVTLYTSTASSNGVYPSAETDAEGGYIFFDLRPTTYIPKASCEGFVTGDPSRDGTLESKFLQLKPTTIFQNVDFHLALAGVISGSVSDEHGMPVKNIEVSAVRVQFSPGGTERQRRVEETKTNAEGNFRLTGLLPGSYFICVNGPYGNTVPGNSYRETYYPDEVSAKSAKRVSAAAGDETKNIRISVKSEKRYTITGKISGTGQLDDSSHFRYSVFFKDHNGGYTMKDDGSFTMPDVPPGDYTFVAMAQELPTNKFVGLGTATVHLTNADAEVKILVGGAGEVSGRAVLPAAQLPLTGIRLGMRSDEASAGSDFNENGHFAVSRVLPGRYFFELTKSDRPIYLKQIRCAGRDYTFEPITIAPEQVLNDCEAVLADDIGVIQGHVSAGNKPASGLTVVLIPVSTDLRKLPRHTMTTKISDDGRFTIPNVIPGEYFLFALPSSDEQAYFALDFADRNQASAQRISVKPRQTLIVDAKAAKDLKQR